MNNERDDRKTHEPTGTTRRQFLSAATGIFALSTYGLFLPATLEATQAREGALDGARGGRRGHNHKGQHRHHRSHGDKKDKHMAPGSGAIGEKPTRVAVRVQNSRNAAIQVQGWQGIRSDNGDPWYMKDKSWDWAAIPAKPNNRPAYNKDFAADKWNLVIRIGMDRVVTVSGGVDDPAAFIITGGWDSKLGPDPTGELLASNDAMRVGSSIATSGITVTRLPDSTTHIWFSVALT